MGMKVCKLVRLTKKDDKGLYDQKSKEGMHVVRKRAVVSEESVNETVENCATTGLLYIVDEKATTARDLEVNGESQKGTQDTL
jgi:hypothetical protein